MKEEKIWAIKDGYLVHRDGSIYKLNWNNTGIMRRVKQTKNKGGYLCFRYNNKLIYTHRFITEAFIANPQNLPCVNHKDENKTNNCVENLEWCTHKYNLNYGTRSERAAESNKGKHRTEEIRKNISKAQLNHPKKSKKVYQYTKDGEFVKEWCSLNEIQRQLGFLIQGISNCCNGKTKSYKDFYWSFKPLADLSESNNSPRVR